eukprot:TRINITY_DN12737_c0_g3_i1.p1 TRINITY_DN12737_c0_g3~~TRINITY_DN12737_c0_g3_i1.p1  ORF type:complete len:283 (-),score=67.90 TRINITY_DN12737_c0_g3_i1:57-839(-)
MGMASQANFALLCELGSHTLCIELPVTSSDSQIKLLRHVSDAYCDFLEELRPEDEALAGMVEKGIAAMSKLKDKVEVEQRQREASCPALTESCDYLEAGVNTASGATTRAKLVTEPINKEIKQESQCGRKSEGEARVSPKQRVTFRLEKEVHQESDSDEGSDAEDLLPLRKSERLWPGDVKNKAERDPTVQRLLQAARDAVDADDQEQQQGQDFDSVMPSKRERDTRRPSKFRSAMQEIRPRKLRASRATRKIYPEGAEC